MSAPGNQNDVLNSRPMSGDKSLKFGLADTFRLAWQDPDLKQRIIFVLSVFAIFALCIHVPVPITGVTPEEINKLIQSNAVFGMLNSFGGRALQRVSILALGLNPYITASIIMQILLAANPAWKKEQQEGGEFGRRQQSKRTRYLTLVLCVGQGLGLIQLLSSSPQIKAAFAAHWYTVPSTIIFWTAGAMLMLWLGEQLTERGIGNGVSLLIFAGIALSFPQTLQLIYENRSVVNMFGLAFVGLLFVLATWFVVYFSIAQRRIPIQNSRRQFNQKVVGGQSGSSYLPFSVVMVGVIPIIFAVSLIYLPGQFAMMMPAGSGPRAFLEQVATYMSPNFKDPRGIVGIFAYTGLIFFFTYFYTAIQFNVDDITMQLKRSQAMIPGVRPGKQTRDFLDGVITRVTVVGAFCLAIVALTQYVVPVFINVASVAALFGTSLLILVSVALETMRQIEANIMMKQYGQ